MNLAEIKLSRWEVAAISPERGEKNYGKTD
jgi:hypothetical protein